MVDTALVHPQAVTGHPALPLQPDPGRTATPTDPAASTQPGQRRPTTTLIGSVQRAVRLLERVAAHDHGAPAKQLARETGLALPTTYHLLRTLVYEGYLRREKGLFHLGSATERLSSSAARQKRRSTIVDATAHWRDVLGVPVYYAMYRDGEIDVMWVSESPSAPAVQEWVDFRETGHAHAIGQCLLSQLDDPARRNHLERYPVRPLTPYTVRDNHSLLRRLERIQRMEPVYERQEYALGTVCAAVPITVATTAATMAISMPVHQSDRLMPTTQRLQRELGRLFGSMAISISI